MNEQTQRHKGILCILCAAMCFAGMTTCVRLSGELPLFEKAFFRNAVAAVIAIVTIRKNHIPVQVGKGNRIYVFCRSLFGTMGLLLNFYAVDRLDLADANMLNKLSPFFAIIFSYFLLGEKIKPVQALAVVGAFAGALCIIKPTGANLEAFPALMGLLSGVGAGAAYTFLRKAAGNGVKGPVIVLIFGVFSSLVCVPFIAMDFVMPTLKQTLLLLLCGICGAGGQFAITAAYTFAPAKEISVYDYTQVIFAGILGFFFFHQIPDWLSLFGCALIISMAVVNFLYHRNEERKAAAQ